MNQFKKCNVHLLPTQKTEVGMISKCVYPYDDIPLGTLEFVANRVYVKNYNESSGSCTFQTQNMYIAIHKSLTEEIPVEVGDYYLVELFDITGKSKGLHLEKCEQITDGIVNKFNIITERTLSECMKVVGSDNKYISERGRPSKKFRQKYVEMNGYEMNEIRVEFTTDAGGWPYDGEGKKAKLIPKLAPDNTIAIRPFKHMYNTKEVAELVKRFSSENFREFTSKHQRWLEANI